jgi:murein DD-endopeptidase MepM/ murein hydrolase activator NlpD
MRWNGPMCLAALALALCAGGAPIAADDGGSPYLLPWPAGLARTCVQGNDGFVSHNGRQRYAFDFAMPVGSTVTAARAGIVIRVVKHHEGRGFRAPNNKVGIRHADGTVGWYLHIRKDGALVREGERVEQGQPIAESGNVGRSLMPHLHFHVTGPGGDTLPVTFRDVAPDGGVPRTLGRYTSENEHPPKLR